MTISGSGDEGSTFRRLFEKHVIEVAHHPDTGRVDLFANGCSVGELPEEPSFLTVEGLHEHPRFGFDSVLAEFLEQFDEEFMALKSLELIFGVVEGGNHDDAGGTDF